MGAFGANQFLVVLFVGMVALFGLALLFVRSSVIERTGLVGGLTLLTSGIAAFLLATVASLSTAALVGIAVLSFSGYVIGRIVDRAMGPAEFDEHMNEGTLGVELAD